MLATTVRQPSRAAIAVGESALLRLIVDKLTMYRVCLFRLIQTLIL
jgi:hypothetical protein